MPRERTPLANDPLIGRRAVEMGFVSESQLDECLRIQKGSPDDRPPLLGQILLRRGYLTVNQLVELMRLDPPSDSRRMIEIPKRYHMLQELGRGGTGTVYLAEDRTLDRVVALKVLNERCTSDPRLRKRFESEARMLARLDHEGIVRVHDAGSSADTVYIVMEYVDGHPVNDYHHGKGKGHRLAASLILAAAEAVHYAHENGIIHRDLKPANILVEERAGGSDAGPRVKVMDFGLARDFTSDTAHTAPGVVLGTPHFMSPEQVKGNTADARSDVYGLGATLYSLLTGGPPHKGANEYEIYERIVRDEPVPPRSHDSRISPELETICLTALRKEPWGRYQSAKKMADDLRRWLAGKAIEAKPPSWAGRILGRVRRHRTAILVAAAFLAMIALGAVWYSEFARERDIRERQIQKKEERLRRAQPLLDEGRRYLADLDRMLTQPSGDPGKEDEAARNAREKFEEVLALVPEHPEALLETARSYRLQEKAEEALEWCNRAIRARSDYGAAYLERAILRLEEYAVLQFPLPGDDPVPEEKLAVCRREIEEDLDAAGKWSGEVPHLEFAEALLKFAQGELEVSARRLERFAGERMADPRAWHWAGVVWHLVEAGCQKARDAMDHAVEYRPRNPLLRHRRGIMKWSAGDLNGALEDFDKAIEGCRDAQVALVCRGLIRMELGDLEGAMADLDRAVREVPGVAPALVCRAGVHRRIGNVEKALADLNRALEIDPDSVMALVERCDTRRMAGDLHGAKEDAEAAIRIDARSGRAYHSLGYVRMDLNDVDAAIEDFSRAIRLDPENASFYFGRGNAYASRGSLGEAVADFTEAIRRKPERLEFRVNRGRAHLMRRNSKAAARDFRRVLRKAPEDWPRRTEVENLLEQARKLGGGR